LTREEFQTRMVTALEVAAAGTATWRTSEDVPDDEFGKDGDFCLVLQTGDVYAKEAGEWVLLRSILGPAGPQGEASTVPGPKGDKGDPGSSVAEAPLISCIQSVGGNATKASVYGDQVAGVPELLVPWAGELYGFAAQLRLPRTAGVCTVTCTFDGVPQLPSAVALNAAVPQNGAVLLALPIPFPAGTRIGAQSVTVGFTPTGSDATASAWIRRTA
jgi:hypothetical protein